MDPFSLVSMQHLSRNHWPKERLIWNFIAKFGELWGNPRKYKSHTALRHRCCIDTKVFNPFSLVSMQHLGTADLEFYSQILWGKYKRRYGTGAALTLEFSLVSMQQAVTTGQRSGPNLESYGATQENTKVTLRYGTGAALTLRCSCGSIQLSVNARHRCCMSRATTGQRNG